MKKLTTLLILLCSFGFANIYAQKVLNISPAFYEASLTPEGEFPNYYTLRSSVQNLSNIDLFVHWKLEDLDIPQGWTISVCDPDVDYSSTIRESRDPFLLQANEPEAKFIVYLNSFGISGCAKFKMNYLDSLSENIIKTVEYEVSVDNENCFTTSATHLEIPNLSVGPNPTRDFIYLSRLEHINRIALYNLQGQMILNSNILVDNSIDLSSVPLGVYFLKVMDQVGHCSTFKIVRE